MNFQVCGEIIKKLPVQSGTTDKGFQWKNQVILVRAYDKDQHVIALLLRGSRVDEYSKLDEGEAIIAFFEIDSRINTSKNGNEYQSTICEAFLIYQYTGTIAEAQAKQDQIQVN